MSIAGGLDIHRKQITFDYPGTVTGQVRRGQVSPHPAASLSSVRPDACHLMRGRWVRVRALPGRAERRVLHAQADSAAEALIFPSDGGQARASGRNRPNVPCSDIADVGSAEFNVCLWRRQSTVLLSQRDRSICSWWPAPLAVAEGASATDPADRPERRCEAISSAARRTWRISSS